MGSEMCIRDSSYNHAFVGNVLRSPEASLPPGQDSNLRAICIDPIGYSLHGGSNLDRSADEVYTFPSGSPTSIDAIFLPRIRIRNTPGSTFAMTDAHVEEIFRFADDLEFDLPDQSTEDPHQVELRDQGVATKRYSEGRFSWFATLVPQSNTDYQLSIAIVRERNAWQAENIRPVSQITSSFGGTTVFQFGGASTELRVGEWFMVSNAPAANVGTLNQVEWYQVVSNRRNDQGTPGDNSDDTDEISARGADWLVPDVGSTPALAIIPARVVAVYSRSIPFRSSAD